MDQISKAFRESFAGDDRNADRMRKAKADLSARLNRVERQIGGIKNIIERDDYCDDVINQIYAARSALESVGKLLLKNHIEGCVVDKIKMGDPEIVEELLVTIRRLH